MYAFRHLKEKEPLVGDISEHPPSEENDSEYARELFPNNKAFFVIHF